MMMIKMPIVIVIGGPVFANQRPIAARLAAAQHLDYLSWRDSGDGIMSEISIQFPGMIIDCANADMKLFPEPTLRFHLISEMKPMKAREGCLPEPVDGVYEIGTAGQSEDEIYLQVHRICSKKFEEMAVG